jgi:YHS domain-containing protein
MKKSTHLAVLMAAIVGIGFSALAADKPIPKKQTTCPVMGGKIDKAQYADVNGYRIYVCCAGCVAKIKADPEKYIKKLEAEGVVIDKVPETKKKDK